MSSFIFLLGIFLFFSLHNPTTASAEGIIIYSKIDIKHHPDVDLVDLDKIHTGLKTLEDGDGWLYFCIDQTKTYPNSTTPPYVPKSSTISPSVKWLIKNFFGNKEGIIGENDVTQYAMTQNAIWSITNPTHTYPTHPVIKNNPKLKALIDTAKTHVTDPDVELEIDKTALELTASKFIHNHPNELFTSKIKAKVINEEKIPDNAVINMNDIKVYLVENGKKQDITNNQNVHLNENNFDIELSIDELYYRNIAPYSSIIVEWDGAVSAEGDFVQAYETSIPSQFQPIATAKYFTLSHDIKDDVTIPVANFVEIKGTKKWNDGNNQDGTRPDSITVKLFANGELFAEQEVTEKTNWTYTFDKLFKYDLEGELIQYTVEEITVPGYTTEQNGNNFTNSYTPLTVSKSVKKVWNDENNKENARPTVVQVQLYADGKAYGQKVKLNEKNNWSYTWGKLPKNNKGMEIKYTVKESSKIKNYSGSIEVDQDGNFVITNTYVKPPEEVTPPIDEDGDEDEEEPNKDGDGVPGQKEPNNKKPTQIIKPSPTKNNHQTLPQTGEQSSVGYFLFGFLFVVAGLILFIRHRRQAKQANN